MATGAVPIEFGRFQGGVVNTVTKSGGNTVSGSVRVGISNDNWRALTPYRGDATLNRRVPSWEFVLGGPIVKNRLFYFGAGQITHNRAEPHAVLHAAVVSVRRSGAAVPG